MISIIEDGRIRRKREKLECSPECKRNLSPIKPVSMYVYYVIRAQRFTVARPIVL